MHKKVLTEQAIYYGDLEMPKNFEIDRPSLGLDVFKFGITNKFPVSKELDKVNKYIIEYSRAKYKIAIVNKKIEGFMYKPGEITKPVIALTIVFIAKYLLILSPINSKSLIFFLLLSIAVTF